MTVAPDSGTEELIGLEGEFMIIVEEGKHFWNEETLHAGVFCDHSSWRGERGSPFFGQLAKVAPTSRG
jgi:hypothetical protein